MTNRRYNYVLTDSRTGKSIKLPEKTGRECKELGIGAGEVLDNYKEYLSVGMTVTYYDGAIKAILNKRKQQIKG